MFLTFLTFIFLMFIELFIGCDWKKITFYGLNKSFGLNKPCFPLSKNSLVRAIDKVLILKRIVRG